MHVAAWPTRAVWREACEVKTLTHPADDAGRGRLHGPAHLPRCSGNVQETAHSLSRPMRHRDGGVGGGQDRSGETADALRHHGGDVQRSAGETFVSAMRYKARSVTARSPPFSYSLCVFCVCVWVCVGDCCGFLACTRFCHFHCVHVASVGCWHGGRASLSVQQ